MMQSPAEVLWGRRSTIQSRKEKACRAFLLSKGGPLAQDLQTLCIDVFWK